MKHHEVLFQVNWFGASLPIMGIPKGSPKRLPGATRSLLLLPEPSKSVQEGREQCARGSVPHPGSQPGLVLLLPGDQAKDCFLPAPSPNYAGIGVRAEALLFLGIVQINSCVLSSLGPP